MCWAKDYKKNTYHFLLENKTKVCKIQACVDRFVRPPCRLSVGRPASMRFRCRPCTALYEQSVASRKTCDPTKCSRVFGSAAMDQCHQCRYHQWLSDIAYWSDRGPCIDCGDSIFDQPRRDFKGVSCSRCGDKIVLHLLQKQKHKGCQWPDYAPYWVPFHRH